MAMTKEQIEALLPRLQQGFNYKDRWLIAELCDLALSALPDRASDGGAESYTPEHLLHVAENTLIPVDIKKRNALLALTHALRKPDNAAPQTTLNRPDESGACPTAGTSASAAPPAGRGEVVFSILASKEDIAAHDLVIQESKAAFLKTLPTVTGPKGDDPEWLARYRSSARPDHQQCAKDYDTLRQRLAEMTEKYRSISDDYQRIIKEVLACNPLPASSRTDDQLEPPWEVIARIRQRAAQAEALLAGARKDAERLDYLDRKCHETVKCISGPVKVWHLQDKSNGTIREAIDAALARVKATKARG